MTENPESETAQTTRVGSMIVASVYLGVMGLLVIGGALAHLMEKKKGRGL